MENTGDGELCSAIAQEYFLVMTYEERYGELTISQNSSDFYREKWLIADS
jgi:hypothetical protein